MEGFHGQICKFNHIIIVYNKLLPVHNLPGVHSQGRKQQARISVGDAGCTACKMMKEIPITIPKYQ